MKRLLFFVFSLFLLPAAAWPQGLPSRADSAEMVVSNFYALTGTADLPPDSILFIESRIVNRGATDPVTMLRWFASNHRFRLELRRGDTLLSAIYGDAQSRFRTSSYQQPGWHDCKAENFFDEAMSYDFRGPLFNWQNRGCELKYLGQFDFQGHPVYAVEALCPNAFGRRYLFEKNTGLLVLFTEDSLVFGDKATHGQLVNRVDWHAYHEYQPLGGRIFFSSESYQREHIIVLLTHQMRFIPFRKEFFSLDTIPQ